MCSPEREGPLLVPAHAVPIDGRRAWHRIQMVGAIGQGGHPLIVPLCFLFPEKTWEIPPSVYKPNTTYQVTVSSQPLHPCRDPGPSGNFRAPPTLWVSIP